MSHLTDLSLAQINQILRSGEVSSCELTQAFLDRIEGLDQFLHAFLTLLPEEALKQADEADRQLRAWRAGEIETLPPLLGVPVAVKDVLCVKDVRCTCGSHILENFHPPFNATAVERLLAAGAIVIGKTNTDEFAMGSSTENSAYGVTHNPW
ncbi:MAG: amidase, partial [bacterium]